MVNPVYVYAILLVSAWILYCLDCYFQIFKVTPFSMLNYNMQIKKVFSTRVK